MSGSFGDRGGPGVVLVIYCRGWEHATQFEPQRRGSRSEVESYIEGDHLLHSL